LTRAATKRRGPKRQQERPGEDGLAGPPPKPQRCAAKTAKGKRCKRKAVTGGELCSVHLGAPVGRPAKLDDATTERILSILRTGGYVEAAAGAAGVSKQTIYNWLERGHPEGTRKDEESPRQLRAEDEPFREFRAKVDRARAEGEATALALIQRAAARDWKAAAWMLERTRPERYAGPRGRGIGSVHPDDFAGGEPSAPEGAPAVADDQVGPDGSPL
jgi:hypothetical protein